MHALRNRLLIYGLAFANAAAGLALATPARADGGGEDPSPCCRWYQGPQQWYCCSDCCGAGDGCRSSTDCPADQ
jgi:hypothetical protein